MTNLDNLLSDLTEDFRPLVAAIEGQSPITKGHYGEYMSAIDQLAKTQPDNPNVYLVIGVALMRAGADRFGVASALRAMGHL